MAFPVEDELIKTVSIEQVVAPIANHLCYLMLLCENEVAPEQLTKLEASANAIAKASRNMADVVSRVMAESDDHFPRMEMAPLMESLIISGQHVLLATQKFSIQPEMIKHREELVEATQNTLLGMVKILLLEDDATVRNITRVAHWLLDCLTEVGIATDIPSLLKAFQVFSKAMLLLHNLVVKRMKDLRDDRQRECVKASMETLKKCISMLHTAMYTTIKHPTSEQAQGAKKYILHHIHATVSDIIITLKSNCKQMTKGSHGYYAERRKRLLELLSDPDSNLFKNSNFDILVRDLVCFSLVIANSSWRQIQSCVTTNCKIVLHFWFLISQQVRGWTNNQKSTGSDQENLCLLLIKQIHELDEVVVKSTLYQLMDTFVLTSGSLEQLVNTVHYLSENDPVCDLDLDSIQPLSNSFIVHMDRVTEVARFISALATDKTSLESVETSKSCLEHLKDNIIPLLLELKGESVQDLGILHKLTSFHQKWLKETEQLLNAFCDVINVKDLIHISVQEMKNDFNRCVKTHKEQDYHLLSKHVRFLIGRMSQVIHFVKRQVDKSDDPIYRNGLLVLVRQAENSAAELKGYASDILNTTLPEYAFSLLADSVTVAIKNIDILYEGLDGIQHPHLLSPLREGARQPASYKPDTTQPQKSRNYTNSEQPDVDGRAIKSNDTFLEKEHSEPITIYKIKNNELQKTILMDSKSVQTSQSIQLLPLLYELVSMTKSKDVKALHTACKGIVELSSCYIQATKEAAYIVEETDNQVMETIRCELVSLTPLLIQTAQETAMSSTKYPDTVYRYSSHFSDLIRRTQKILLPVTAMWNYAIQATIYGFTPNILDSCIQELTEVMHLCTDTVQLVALTDVKGMSKSNDSITSLLSKLQKAQTNTKNLIDILGKKSSESDEFEGFCFLWALSIQILLSSMDRILGTSTHSRSQLNKYHVTNKKWLSSISETSLRLQEAARLSYLTCKGKYKVQILKKQDEVKTLTEVYLQAAEDLDTLTQADVLTLARTELLQRQLQFRMKALSCLLSRVNDKYVTAIQNTISLASTVRTENGSIEGEEALTKFETTAELLLGCVKTATESLQNCLNFIRDPQVRSSLRFISDLLVFQISEIISRTRLMAKTQSVFETFDLDIQIQCWSAKAQYIVEEIYKVDGILHVTKEQIKHGLQGKECRSVLKTDMTPSFISKETSPPRPVDLEKIKPAQNHLLPVDQKCKMDLLSQREAGTPAFISADPTIKYTPLSLMQEKAENWNSDDNQIVKVTKEMADIIHHMTLYLKRKGPIQSKEAFVSSAKELVLSCQTITQFVKVIADHCLDKHSTKELCIIAEQIITITNQFTIISRAAWCLSSVNAVTPRCKASDEILVKNAQNLLQTVIQGVRAAETACIKGLKQPEPNSEGEKAACLCIQWKKYLLMHRAREQLNPETDDLGLRKTSIDHAAPSLAPPIGAIKRI